MSDLKTGSRSGCLEFSTYIPKRRLPRKPAVSSELVVPANAPPANPAVGNSAEEEEMAIAERPSPLKLPLDSTLPTNWVPGNHSNPVYVRGYTRVDGTSMKPHYPSCIRNGSPNNSMKLAEALPLRANIQKKLSSLQQRPKSTRSCKRANDLLKTPKNLCQIEGVAGEFQGLVFAINKANLQHSIRTGQTLTEA